MLARRHNANNLSINRNLRLRFECLKVLESVVGLLAADIIESVEVRVVCKLSSGCDVITEVVPKRVTVSVPVAGVAACAE